MFKHRLSKVTRVDSNRGASPGYNHISNPVYNSMELNTRRSYSMGNNVLPIFNPIVATPLIGASQFNKSDHSNKIIYGVGFIVIVLLILSIKK